jgi:hypothetical protein
MSIIAMPFTFRTYSLFTFGLYAAISGCTSSAPTLELSPGHPVLANIGAPSASAIDRLEITARLPSIPAWTLRLRKDDLGVWRMTSRSDLPDSGADLADAKLVTHLIEILESFTSESSSQNGTDASFGMTPYIFEARLSSGTTTKILRLGELVGPTGIYFRVGEESKKTWIGRGAIIPFLATLSTPDSFISKSPYTIEVPGVETLTLEKLVDPGRGRWTFKRDGDLWLNGEKKLSLEDSARIERVARQRVHHLASASESIDFTHPDWRITMGTETMDVLFHLNSVYGKNVKRSERALVLYPEFAGALRAFTQARFTPVKSGTK